MKRMHLIFVSIVVTLFCWIGHDQSKGTYDIAAIMAQVFRVRSDCAFVCLWSLQL